MLLATFVLRFKRRLCRVRIKELRESSYLNPCKHQGMAMKTITRGRACAILRDKDRVLASRGRSDSYWAMPGGGIDPGEFSAVALGDGGGAWYRRHDRAAPVGH
jgi:hypothetical protein